MPNPTWEGLGSSQIPTSVFLSPLSDDGSENEASVSNKFVNDGSFLQQFLKLQKEKSNAGRSSLSQPKSRIPKNNFPTFFPQKLPQIPPTTLGMLQPQTLGRSGWGRPRAFPTPNCGFPKIIFPSFSPQKVPQMPPAALGMLQPNPGIPRNHFPSFSSQKMLQISPITLGMPQL